MPQKLCTNKRFGKTKILRPIRKNSTFLTKGAKIKNAPDRCSLTSASPRVVIYVRSGPFFCCSHGQNITFFFSWGKHLFFDHAAERIKCFRPAKKKKKFTLFEKFAFEINSLQLSQFSEFSRGFSKKLMSESSSVRNFTYPLFIKIIFYFIQGVEKLKSKNQLTFFKQI